jgi:hypothetical protein
LVVGSTPTALAEPELAPAGGATCLPVNAAVPVPPNVEFSVIGIVNCVPPEGVTSAVTGQPSTVFWNWYE